MSSGTRSRSQLIVSAVWSWSTSPLTVVSRLCAMAFPSSTRLMRKFLASIGLICCLALFFAATRPRESLYPSRVAVGDRVPVLIQLSPSTPAPERQVVNLVVVSKHCGVCIALVKHLAATQAAPRSGHVVEMLADTVWSELSQLEGRSVSVLTWPRSLGKDLGLRATPTVVSIDHESKRVIHIGVGRAAVESVFFISTQHANGSGEHDDL